MCGVSSSERDVVLYTFGQAVRRRRQNLGLTQEQLAQRAGLGRSYVTDVELGLRNVALTTIVRLAVALEMPVSRLLQDLDEMALPPQPGG
jgi:transcriptional regulator with XRE-family HTH domain